MQSQANRFTEDAASGASGLQYLAQGQETAGAEPVTFVSPE